MFQTAPQTKRDLNRTTQRQKLSTAYAHTLKKKKHTTKLFARGFYTNEEKCMEITTRAKQQQHKLVEHLKLTDDVRNI
jgi:hypothetical protein